MPRRDGIDLAFDLLDKGPSAWLATASETSLVQREDIVRACDALIAQAVRLRAYMHEMNLRGHPSISAAHGPAVQAAENAAVRVRNAVL